MLSHFSCVQLNATLWIVAFQVPLSKQNLGQKYWSGLPCPSPGDLADPGIELMSLPSSALAGRFFTANATWEVSLRGEFLLNTLRKFAIYRPNNFEIKKESIQYLVKLIHT